LLLISGGASVGERDFTHRLLERFGYAIRISQTSTRPGKPLIVAQRGGAIAFGLPGNPLAHFVCLNLYVRAALDSFSGCQAESPFRQGRLATELEAGGNARETFWPARQSNENGCAQLTAVRQYRKETHFFWRGSACNLLTGRAWTVAGAM
jgi:molybdopterin molybdotransferase